ncbi:MAG: DUF2391 family protein [Candidatus Woesearchaeota archaeon]
MHQRISRLEREIEDIQFENITIKKDVEDIKNSIDKTPEHFSEKDILRAFVGSLFLGFSIIFSGNLLTIVRAMPFIHIWIIILFTLLVLTAEIYFIGYKRVLKTDNRKFGQFWIKRLLAFYIVAIIVAFILTYIFGLIYLADGTSELIKILFIVSGPAAIGASIGDLLKKY